MRRVYPASTSIPRCQVCGVHEHLCFCAGFPVLATRTKIVFLQHPQEARKPTNSARLACRILSDASIVPWSRVEPPRLGDDAILLYPSPDATPLEPHELAGSATVVIPDGTWSQASRIASVLRNTPLRRRILPTGNATTWTVRQSDDPERISSAQAAAMALHLAGEPEAATSLYDAVREAGRRILAMRGISADRRDPIAPVE
ncbi:MAG TPA: tRNA-uridine aminocarboxypropyltransferase [Fibrobacteria bacterium]|nr:tRNA-uridine aminocarboxypropyltransferase [Fibrobacteria bacterium]